MATPADKRLLELLEKWLKSLELHLKYSALDDESYSHVQVWPEHQRPSRWILDLAKQKAITLQTQIQDRVKARDIDFSESLELMSFLANLLGAEHIERFIPLASPPAEAADTSPPQNPSDSAMTREMPKLPVAKTQAPTATDQVARPKSAPKTPQKPALAAKQPAPKPLAHPAPRAKITEPPSPSGAPPERATSPDAIREQVIADAARLVQWGRKWYELAELISSMADRPSLIDVRRILQDNKAVIDKKAGRG